MSSILATAKSDALAQGSVHLSGTGQVSGLSLREAIDAGRAAGKVSSVVGSHVATAMLVNGVVYVRSDAYGLEHAVGLSHAQSKTYAGRWLAFRHGNSHYSDLAAGLDLASGLHDTLDLTTARNVGASSVSGHDAVVIRGTDANGDESTLFISSASPHLLLRSRSKGQTFLTDETYGRWGEPVRVTAPRGAVPGPR